MAKFQIIETTPNNYSETGCFCLNNPKKKGYEAKKGWFEKQFSQGLKLLQLYPEGEKKAAGFIEYVPGEYAWRPVKALNQLFIHCIFIYPTKHKNKGYAQALIEAVIDDAKAQGKTGVCVTTSEKAWMSGKKVFELLGFELVESKGRFDLMFLQLKTNAEKPSFRNWEQGLEDLQGWHLIYSDQCPHHDKAALELQKVAYEYGITLNIDRLETPKAAQHAASGIGTFALIHNGKLMEDHYISATRFRNIVNSTRRH